MRQHVCPWWGGYFIDNRLRHLLHNPEKILAPYVRPGMHVLDFGCGMGFMSIAMAKMVGEAGSVVAVDLQRQMLDTVEKRAAKAGVAERIRTHQCEKNALGIQVAVDFLLAFYAAHEVPDKTRFFAEAHQSLVDGGTMLLVEPRGHVNKRDFQTMLDAAREAGFTIQDGPHVRLSHTALLNKDRGGIQS